MSGPQSKDWLTRSHNSLHRLRRGPIIDQLDSPGWIEPPVSTAFVPTWMAAHPPVSSPLLSLYYFHFLSRNCPTWPTWHGFLKRFWNSASTRRPSRRPAASAYFSKATILSRFIEPSHLRTWKSQRKIRRLLIANSCRLEGNYWTAALEKSEREKEKERIATTIALFHLFLYFLPGNKSANNCRSNSKGQGLIYICLVYFGCFQTGAN